MATSIYLGNPPETIKNWIIAEAERKQQEQFATPLTFTAQGDNANLSLKVEGGTSPLELVISTTGNENDWQAYKIGDTITLEKAGDKVMFKSSKDGIQPLCEGDILHSFHINGGEDTGNIKVSGNIMYLMDKTGKLRDLSDKIGAFMSLFSGCTNLTDASELLLPAEKVSGDCYYNMFGSCENLIKGPKVLPATELAQNCYGDMFRSCYSLIEAPKLPAETMAKGCYNAMFQYCESLTQAPALPATTLAEGCYSYMFRSCRNLNKAQSILPAMSLNNGCYTGMFYMCESLTQAPELPATSLAYECYNYMFEGCEALNSIKVGFTTWNNTCTSYWLRNVASEGTFTCPSALPDPETRNESTILEKWTINRI